MMGLALAATLGLCAPAGADVLDDLKQGDVLDAAAMITFFYTECANLQQAPTKLRTEMRVAISQYGAPAIRQRTEQIFDPIKRVGGAQSWCTMAREDMPPEFLPKPNQSK
jgi:hypothetical protein